MTDGEVKLDVKVHPGAGKNQITGFANGVLAVKITAQPEKGKANAALVKYLSDVLGIAKSRIEIVKGETSRNKTVRIDGPDAESLLQKLVEYGR